MPNQSNIQQTILNGKYSLATLVNNNLSLIMQGGLAIKQVLITWFDLNLQALIDQYAIGDYTSNTTIVLYDRVNYFVGIPYGAEVDPNYQGNGIIIEVTTGGFAPPIITQIIGGVTLDPITVPYTGFTNPTLIFRNADGSNYNGAVNNIDTGTSIILSGDSGDGVTFADSFEFVIKQ